MTEQVRIEWIDLHVPDDCPREIVAGMRAGIDAAGDVWVWSGLINSKDMTLAIAMWEGEPWVIDGGEEFLRVGFLRRHCVVDEICTEVLDLVESKVHKFRLH